VLGSDVMRGYNDMLILHLLMEKDSYGYEISKDIEWLCKGMYNIKETTLYSAFGRLEKLNFVTAYQGTQSQGRPRTYYAITDKGKEVYRQKCEEWKILKSVINTFTMEGK